MSGSPLLDTLQMISEDRGSYRINLPIFEGPFDLLLHLIRKHDLNIHDIEIATLTEEYLQYIDAMKALDIDMAGEFLVMAAELMHMKSQLLLPITPELEEEMADPRGDLVRRLLEYQRFKEAAQVLDQRQMLMRDVYCALGASPDLATDETAPVPMAGANVYQLIEAFDRVLRTVPIETYHAVAVDRISVTQRIYEIAAQLAIGRAAGLEKILPLPLTRYSIVVTFLALLEMARLGMISLFQGGNHETLFITKQMDVDTGAMGDNALTEWQG
ncbi:MAG: segregation/condensation protein A [Deltaproteobacteria bacterium]|nr:segregation/condensation protein A [Deltaproteobacteria bacterium]